jgi:hypothetical protein
MRRLYGTERNYRKEFAHAVDDAVTNQWLLNADADQLKIDLI